MAMPFNVRQGKTLSKYSVIVVNSTFPSDINESGKQGKSMLVDSIMPSGFVFLKISIQAHIIVQRMLGNRQPLAGKEAEEQSQQEWMCYGQERIRVDWRQREPPVHEARLGLRNLGFTTTAAHSSAFKKQNDDVLGWFGVEIDRTEEDGEQGVSLKGHECASFAQRESSAMKTASPMNNRQWGSSGSGAMLKLRREMKRRDLRSSQNNSPDTVRMIERAEDPKNAFTNVKKVKNMERDYVRQDDLHSSALSRSILVNVEAKESDALDDEPSDLDDDEATAAERARQAAESVPLQRHDEISEVLRVANEWEKFAVEQNRRVQEQQEQNRERPLRESGKRKIDSPAAPSPRKRARAKSSSPPPNTFREGVPTAKGIYFIYLPEIPGENELQRETHIYEASEPIIAAVDKEVLAEMTAQRSTPAASAATSMHQGLASAYSSPIPMPPAAQIDEEWTGGASTPTKAPAHTCSPPAPRARSPKVPTFDPCIAQGWKIMQRMLTDAELKLPEARKEVHELFGDDYENNIWTMLNKINDLDPNEFETMKGAIEKEVEGKMALANDADVEMRSLSARITKDEGQGEQGERETVYLDTHSACLEQQLHEQQLLAQWIAQSHDATINPLDYQVFSIACWQGSELDAFNKISTDIEAGRVHASILQCVFKSRYPGCMYIQAYSLLYRHSFKTSFPNENAWSRQIEKIKREPPPVLNALDLAMPIHMRVEDVRYDANALETSGRYKGDLGVVLNDDFNEINTSLYALVAVVPRIRKRYQLYGQTVWGGFVLLTVKLEALDLALRVPDDDFAIFTTIAEGDCLGRIPPLTSWTFQEKETVILRHPRIPTALPVMHWEEDLGKLTDGAEGVIQKVGELVCDIAFKEKGEVVDVRSVAYCHLVKKLVVGQTVRLATGVCDLKEIQWIQQGDSGVLTVKERRLELANNERLISSVYMHPSWAQLVDRNHWQVTENKTKSLQTLSPEEYFAQSALSKSGCIPWLGVRVFLRTCEREDCSGWRGEVIYIAQDVENSANYFVLVHWNHTFWGDQLFDWCNYNNVLRTDNHGLLHEFTPYSSTLPWKGVTVKVVKQGVYKDCEGVVQDARADLLLDRDTVSGISVQICFNDGDLVGENRTAWVDYHYVRRCDTKLMRFLHDSVIGDKELVKRKGALLFSKQQVLGNALQQDNRGFMAKCQYRRTIGPSVQNNRPSAFQNNGTKCPKQ
ncbi:hypothetical protein BT96DRAFT_948031 [Gymnopus androsaceus JB14]|uniref:Uncharacterized protein n=1 Tax=Gymnopus androsaceus JB14 TaxID=1447944 RepID=A0A6A4GRM5_9AGAR|nr:hypothetical protein BT96DRAFT_948031 [Gymnopus androsaceus JB14]